MCDVGDEELYPLISPSGHLLPTSTVVTTVLRDERNIGYRLDHRKILMIYRQRIVKAEFIFAMIGLLMMLINTELYIHKVDANEYYSLMLIIRFVMSSSTLLLMVAVYFYHKTQVKLLKLNKNVDDWRMVVSCAFILTGCTELLICAIHPIPGDIVMPFLTIDGHLKHVSIDAVLSILMLLRLYIVLKFIVMHNKWILSTSMVSFGALNEVDVNTDFFFKCLMRDHAAVLVVSIMLAIFVVNSWAMRTCESYFVPDNEQSNVYNSMWLVAITFLTVGYGDLAPNSYCGRVIAAETGVMGVAITALLVTVITSKFRQTRSERYVHAFMIRVKLERKKKNAAARVITVAMVRWYLRRHDQLTGNRVSILKRKLRKAVKKMRDVDRRLAAISLNALGLVEVSNEMENICSVVEAMQAEITNLVNRSKLLDSFLIKIDNDLSTIQAAVGRSSGYH